MKTNAETEYVSPQISFIEIRVEHGFAASSTDFNGKDIELDGFDINNPDGNFSMDE